GRRLGDAGSHEPGPYNTDLCDLGHCGSSFPRSTAVSDRSPGSLLPQGDPQLLPGGEQRRRLTTGLAVDLDRSESLGELLEEDPDLQPRERCAEAEMLADSERQVRPVEPA